MEEEEEAVEGAVEGRAVREEDENLTPQVVEVPGGRRQPRGEAHMLTVTVSRCHSLPGCQVIWEGVEEDGGGWD